MSTFRHFRKHSKAFFAVASVLAIGLFVFGSGMGGGGSQADGPRRSTSPVAAWNGGSINEGQLQALLGQRLVTNEFLTRLFIGGGGENPRYDLPQGFPDFLVNNDDADALLEEVVNTEVFSSLATQAGMSVSDEMINHYIKEFGLGRVGSDGVRSALGSAGEGGARTNEAIVFSTLRKLLLSFFYRRAYDDVAATVLPEQRWEDWRRVNEKISLEVAVLPVEDFLDEAPKPTDAQLKAFYNKFRDGEPGALVSVYYQEELPSPNPGFAEPRRVKLQYLVGDVPARTKTLLASVTDAEIADYYERNKRKEFTKTAGDELDFGSDLMPEGDETAEAEGAADGAAGDGVAGDGDETPADEPADAPADAGETPVDSTGTSEGAEAATETDPAIEAAAADAAPTADGEAAETTDAPADVAEPAPAGSDSAEPAAAEGDQASVSRRSPFRFAALQAAPAEGAPAADQATEAEAAAAPAEAEAAEDEAAEATTTPATTPEAETDESAAEDAEATAGDAADAAVNADAEADAAAETNDPSGSNEAEAAPADAVSDDAALGDAAASDAAAEDEPVEYVPLAEVSDLIRERLAREKAVEQLQQQIAVAGAKLQTEYNQYGRLVIEKSEAKEKPPTPPQKLSDLKWLADEYNLTLAPTTDPLSARELFDLPVGKAVDDQTGRFNVTQAAFTTLSLYEPLVARELNGDWYLVIKTEDTPRRVPTFDEVRDKVAAAWKRAEAAKLAQKKAQDLAKELESAAQPFEEIFKDKGFKVIPQTALFSWRMYSLGMPGMGYPAVLSNVPELKNVGPDFMEVAFDLGEGDVKGLLNFDNSEAYVIRLHSRQYMPEELKKVFLRDVNSWMGARDMQQEHFFEFQKLVYQQVSKEIAGFEYDEEWRKRREADLAERD